MSKTNPADLNTIEYAAYTAMRGQGADRDQAMRLVVEGPQDTTKGRKNQGWFDGREAARQAFERNDHRALTLGFLGTKHYQDAFQDAVPRTGADLRLLQQPFD